MEVDVRKQKEAEFHNLVRDEGLKKDDEEYKRLTANKKFYSITRASDAFVHDWILQKGRGKKVLDYCCGDGYRSVFFAKNGVNAVGIDISDVSIENCKARARREGVSANTEFFVMDAEATNFPENTFDAVACLGVLHHLDTEKAFREIARVLKPNGHVICGEPIAYNPLFQVYRRLTPHLRTEWEMHHILSKKDFDRAKKYFGKIEMRFFHLTTLAAVPFRNTFVFEFLLGILEKMDGLLLRIPLVQWLAWQVVFILSEPRKDNDQTTF